MTTIDRRLFLSTLGRTGAMLAAGSLLVAAFAALGASPALAQVDISVAKDTIELKLDRRSCTMNDEGCKQTDLLVHPILTCEVNAALPSGSQPWVEFRMPGKPALRMDMEIREVWNTKDRWTITCR